jgi:aspartyl-tRNA(Asn)/glutamyl-tRNA(Gln) amidotransferase subunit A
MNGTTTCVEAVHFYLQQVQTHQNLNAWLEIFEEEALQRAAELDAKRLHDKPLGKLHGVVIGLKDVICYKGHRVSASSKMLEGFTSVYNATVTDRLLAEDAIILGRQNCDEFAMGSTNENSAYGPARNAADDTRVAGGSSGGSAVAVQANMCMVSLGSDTGGSVRQPADFCGVVGYKPTYGTISRYGLIAYASSFDQIGIFAKSVQDVADVLDVIGGSDEFDSTCSSKTLDIPIALNVSESKPLRICYFENALNHPSLDVEISTQVNSFMEKLTSAGHSLEPVDFELLDYIIPTYYVLTTAEASSNLSRYDGVRYGKKNTHPSIDINEAYKTFRSEGFGPEVKRRILLGTFVLSAGYYDAYFNKAQQVRRKLYEYTNKLFQQYDVILLPTVPSPAFKLGEKKDPVELFLADIYTVYANLVGIPAISLPLFNTSTGLPFGLQLMTSRHNDLPLLRLSKAMMQLH